MSHCPPRIKLPLLSIGRFPCRPRRPRRLPMTPHRSKLAIRAQTLFMTLRPQWFTQTPMLTATPTHTGRLLASVGAGVDGAGVATTGMDITAMVDIMVTMGMAELPCAAEFAVVEFGPAVAGLVLAPSTRADTVGGETLLPFHIAKARLPRRAFCSAVLTD